MPRKLIGCVLPILLLVLLTGCWNSRELNSLALAVGLGIDKVGDRYLVSAQVVVPSNVASSSKGEGVAVTMFKAEGKTVFEALRRMTTSSPRKIYLAHLRVLVLGEELAKEGVTGPIEFLSRDHEPRTDFFIVVAKHLHAEDVLKVITSLEKIPANRMYFSLYTSERVWAPTSMVTLDEVIQDLITEGKSLALTAIELKGREEIEENKANTDYIDPPSKLHYAGLAYFHRDKLVGWMNEDESKVYNYLRDNVKNTVGTISCPGGGQIALEVVRSKTELQGRVVKGKPQIQVEIHTEANVGNVECDLDLLDLATIDMLEKAASKQMEETIMDSAGRMQEKVKFDIFGFGDVIHRNDPKGWAEVKDDWEQHLADLDLDVKAEIKIRRLGTTGNSFLQEIKE
ncbi:Ger(x)C family spore germination protein [Paenibacillus sp. GCM10023248]|uniref:Ger(x)C family spore germination protein n=1 Tax=unclassified Paenibacillus TaxID=185978 RepID=UPI002379393F|nr:Ger(x)C family spore germination protein [Paenibacillus sp. MAHUQ-63]MDD9270586.1 Ger(x)C family spore germination protein [Paenibacillus sp. MAHUQ-63]